MVNKTVETKGDMKIKCPNCRKTFREPKDYADHIIKVHPNDKTGLEWAYLITSTPSPELHYLGKPVSYIPPGRVKDLPKYLQDQLTQQTRETTLDKPQE